MSNFRNFVAAGVAMAASVIAGNAIAQEKSEVPNSEVPESELLENISTTERLRRRALDAQAVREVVDARMAMGEGEYNEAVSHYGVALKLLNDSPKSKDLRKNVSRASPRVFIVPRCRSINSAIAMRRSRRWRRRRVCVILRPSVRSKAGLRTTPRSLLNVT